MAVEVAAEMAEAVAEMRVAVLGVVGYACAASACAASADGAGGGGGGDGGDGGAVGFCKHCNVCGRSREYIRCRAPRSWGLGNDREVRESELKSKCGGDRGGELPMDLPSRCRRIRSARRSVRPQENPSRCWWCRSHRSVLARALPSRSQWSMRAPGREAGTEGRQR